MPTLINLGSPFGSQDNTMKKTNEVELRRKGAATRPDEHVSLRIHLLQTARELFAVSQPPLSTRLATVFMDLVRVLVEKLPVAVLALDNGFETAKMIRKGRDNQ